MIYLVKKLQARLALFWHYTGDNMPDVRILHPKQLALNGANEDEWAATTAGAAAQVVIQTLPSDDL